MTEARYRGRFAPSPTGPLHIGSLIAASASYLQARSQGGEWWLRIEDIDPPREVEGASDAILYTLEAFGFEWDGPISYQSRRSARYHAALAELRQRGLLYPCACSRKDIAKQGADGIYPGTCRDGLPAGRTPRAWRVRAAGRIEFEDRIQGPQHTDLEAAVGDYVLHRADGLFAYQLAVALDDAEQGMTEVVRGADLLDSTPRQIYLQQCLGLSSPRYAHHPVATGRDGQKLSKQTAAPALDTARPQTALLAALRFLGQDVDRTLADVSLQELWQCAISRWNPARIPRLRAIALEEPGNLSDTVNMA